MLGLIQGQIDGLCVWEPAVTTAKTLDLGRAYTRSGVIGGAIAPMFTVLLSKTHAHLNIGAVYAAVACAVTLTGLRLG